MVANEWSKEYERKLVGGKQASNLKAREDGPIFLGIGRQQGSYIGKKHISSQSAPQKKDQDCFLFLCPLPFFGFLPLV